MSKDDYNYGPLEHELGGGACADGLSPEQPALTETEAQLVIGAIPLQALPEQPAWEADGDVLETQEFYELMQAYRHARIVDHPATVEAYEAVKQFVRDRDQQLITRLTEALAEVLNSGVEFDGHAGYVVMQVDRDTLAQCRDVLDAAAVAKERAL